MVFKMKIEGAKACLRLFFNEMFFLFRYAHDGGKSRKGTLTLEVPRVTNVNFSSDRKSVV